MLTARLQGEEILCQARKLLPDVVALRQRLHRHPELGLTLPRTRETVLAELQPLGLETRLSETISSVVADLAGSDGPTVLLRADMDALPIKECSGEPFASAQSGRMHACGHDAHTAMLVGAARILSSQRHSMRGRIRFVFQPGEENHFGAQAMVREGVLDGVDSAFALHVTPTLPAGVIAIRKGPIMAAANSFVIAVDGIGGHASMPHLIANPIPALCQLAQALQAIVPQEISAFDPAVISIGQLAAGDVINAIPSTGRIAGTFRTVSRAARTKITKAISRLSKGIAAAHNCTATVTIGEGYPATVNATESCAIAKTAAASLLPASSVVELANPLLGADDFGFMLRDVPGAMSLLGVCPADIRMPQLAPPCHANNFRIDENSLAIGTAMHVATALLALSG